MRVGIHASQELFSPARLLDRVQRANQRGFRHGSTSDHFHPWTTDQGHSGFAWSWLGAALARTSMTWGIVTTPGYRYHPAVLAQAAATIDQMFPGRFWLALGSGESLNESVVGQPWPAKQDRHTRLLESVDIIRRLWQGETVSYQGHIQIDNASLYTRPATKIPIFGAALTESTSAWCGKWSDGLITAGAEIEGLRLNIRAYRSNGGAGKPVAVQVMICFANSATEALALARKKWRVAALDTAELANVATPSQFDKITSDIKPEDLKGKLLTIDNSNALKDWLKEAASLGIDEVDLHDLGDHEEELLSMASHVG